MNMNLRKFASALRLGVMGAVLGGATLASAGQANAAVVINEVYGSGNNAGASLRNDYVELYNNGPAAVNLAGYTIQYASATGAFQTANSQVTTITTGTIAPSGYFLVVLAGGTTNGSAVPTGDATGLTNLSGTTGKVALVSDSTLASGPTGTNVVDFVGYGTATQFEGTVAPAPSLTTSIFRTVTGVDSNNNGADFTAGTPTPQNSSPATPTATPIPGSTATPVPTATTAPAATSTPLPTATPGPTSTPIPQGPPSTTLVISEVYGGGGNSGATYANDFIEIYNLGSTTVDLTGYTVQYASTGGTFTQSTALTGTIAPGAYYLVQESSAAAVGAALPSVNATGNINLSATNGKVALANNATAVTSPGDSNVVDFVGFGTANQFEGTAAAPAGSNTTSITRTVVTTDTNNNAADFSVVAPSPQSSAPTATPVPLKISEFRLTGPNGARDEYIELANQTGSAVTLTGYTLTASSAGTALAGLDLTGKIIPAFGHLLITNDGGYSLDTVYPATYPVNTTTPDTFSTGDVRYTGDINIDSTLTLSFGSTVVDTVGNLSNTTGLGLTDQYAFVRRQDGPSLVDTGNDATSFTNDFNLVDISSTTGPTDSTGISTLALGARLGTPGPQNAASPISRAAITLVPISIPGTIPEGRYVTKNSPVDPQGRLSLRRTITNNTSTTITQIRFILVRTTSGISTNTDLADLRALSSTGVLNAQGVRVVQGIQIEAPTTPVGLSASLSPSTTGNGGGLNSSWNVGSLPAGGLAPGQSMNVEFLFGIVKDGNYNTSVVAQILPKLP